MATRHALIPSYSETSAPPTTLNTWAAWMSYCLAYFGWVQTNDSGQASWFGLSITAAANVSGNTWRYTYTVSSSAPGYGPGAVVPSGSASLQVGQCLTPAGMTHSGNNVPLVIASFAGGAGTFDAVNATGQAESGSSGTTTLNNNVGATANTSYAPSAANTAAYEIWTSNDALSSTYKMYVKIWYGVWSTNSTGIWFQMGTGSDGAGNLTGNLSASFVFSEGAANSTTNLFPCYASGDASRFQFCMFDSSSGSAATSIGGNGIITVERSHDNTGADTATYASIVQMGYTDIMRQQCVFPYGSKYGTTSVCRGGVTSPSLMAVIPISASTWAFNGTTGVGPIFPELGCLGNPLLGLVAVFNNDFIHNQPFQLSMYGTPRTYLPVQSQNANFTPCRGQGASRPAMRYD